MSFPSSPRSAAALLFLLSATTLLAQQAASHPPDYPGVRTFIPGVFVTPVPGAPFSGTVEVLSKTAPARRHHLHPTHREPHRPQLHRGDP